MPANGRIVQVVGSTFDAEFAEDELPKIFNAVGVMDGEELLVTGEVEQHLGGGRVRCVALGTTDGLRRGMTAADTGKPVMMPVGPCTLGRIFNVLGEPVDGRGPVEAEEYRLDPRGRAELRRRWCPRARSSRRASR